MSEPPAAAVSAGSRVLITGGSGYFGCALRDRLLAKGCAVRVLDLVDVDPPHPEVEFLRGDIRDPESVRRACRDVEIVFHNVAQVPLAKNRALFDSVNVTGTEVLLDVAVASGVRKLVHTSSSAIFGIPEHNPVDRDTPPRPLEAYGRAKWAAELRIRKRTERDGLDATVIRPRTILGHGRLGIFQILFEWVSEGRRIPVLGRGDNRYQFVHADDLAEACWRAATRTGAATYHIGAERFGTMRETLEALCRHADTGSRVYPLPQRLAEPLMRLSGALGLSPLGPYHALLYGRSLWFDIEPARIELGWRPRWSNEEMICESYDWYRAHRDRLAAPGGSPHQNPVRQRLLRLLKHLS